jgi:uncharacterized protein (DUF58 family)
VIRTSTPAASRPEATPAARVALGQAHPVQRLLDRLLARSRTPAPDRREIVLTRRRIFILPARAGVVFGAILLLMLVGAINYGLSLALMLTFLLASFGITAMLHTFRNLAGLRVTAVRAEPVFAGETAHFGLAVHNPTPLFRCAIRLTGRAALVSGSGSDTPGHRGHGPRLDEEVADIAGESSAILTVRVPALERGLLRAGRLTLHTRYPVGLYHAWSYVELDAPCVVYPQPAPRGMPLPLAPTQPVGAVRAASAADDFAGLRTYQRGDAPKHIAWKAAARGRELLTKQFHGAQGGEVWLSLDSLPESAGLEQRISQLARWVLDAHLAGMRFGLRLSDTTLGPASGDRHRDRCLEALALHPDARASGSAASS